MAEMQVAADAHRCVDIYDRPLQCVVGEDGCADSQGCRMLAVGYCMPAAGETNTIHVAPAVGIRREYAWQ